MVKTYTDCWLNDNTRIRRFDSNINNVELVWHQDAYTRRVTVLEGIGWKLQLDNQLPIDLLPDTSYTIPRELHHRLLKGCGELIIEIKEEINQ